MDNAEACLQRGEREGRGYEHPNIPERREEKREPPSRRNNQKKGTTKRTSLSVRRLTGDRSLKWHKNRSTLKEKI